MSEPPSRTRVSGNHLFVRLPQELRFVIWEIVVTGEDYYTDEQVDSPSLPFTIRPVRDETRPRSNIFETSPRSDATRSNHALTLTCRLCRRDHEDRPTFYHVNKFLFLSTGEFVAYMAAISPSRQQAIRHVFIHEAPPLFTLSGRLRRSWRRRSDDVRPLDTVFSLEDCVAVVCLCKGLRTIWLNILPHRLDQEFGQSNPYALPRLCATMIRQLSCLSAVQVSGHNSDGNRPPRVDIMELSQAQCRVLTGDCLDNRRRIREDMAPDAAREDVELPRSFLAPPMSSSVPITRTSLEAYYATIWTKALDLVMSHGLKSLLTDGAISRHVADVLDKVDLDVLGADRATLHRKDTGVHRNTRSQTVLRVNDSG